MTPRNNHHQEEEEKWIKRIPYVNSIKKKMYTLSYQYKEYNCMI